MESIITKQIACSQPPPTKKNTPTTIITIHNYRYLYKYNNLIYVDYLTQSGQSIISYKSTINCARTQNIHKIRPPPIHLTLLRKDHRRILLRKQGGIGAPTSPRQHYHHTIATHMIKQALITAAGVRGLLCVCIYSSIQSTSSLFDEERPISS